MVVFFARLVGVMIDPGVFVPVLAASYLLRGQNRVWQISASTLVGILAAVILAFVTYSARRAYGGSLFNGILPHYVAASLIWSVASSFVIGAFSKRGPDARRG